MKTIRFFYGVSILLAGMLFTACQDDLTGPSRYNDGKLHFKFSFDENGQWNKDNAQQKKTRLMAPIVLATPNDNGQPLYLHCEEANYIEPESTAADTTVTRGQRITDEAFDPTNPNAVSSFGLYAVVGGEEVLSVYDKKGSTDESDWEKLNTYTEIQRSSLNGKGEWYIDEQELLFSGNNAWKEDMTGNFYGFAPFPGWDGAADASHPDGDAGHTRCIWVDTSNPSQPIINFMMQPEEEYNKDILMAQKTGVTQSQKDAGVEMYFHHALSALKFKYDNADNMKYKVGIGGTEYYLKIKTITLEGIYDQGSVVIGNAYTDAGGTRTSNWVIDDTSTGSCTATLNRSQKDVADDSEKLINTDAHCFMVLPQIAPTGAKFIITADLTSDAEGNNIVQENFTFDAKLEGKTWLPGYSYTYTISKDSRALSYSLQSVPDGGSNGGAFSFTKDGGSMDFDVTSYANYSDGGVAGTEPATWHVEYSTDGGSNWVKGLPTGFSLARKSDGVYVGTDNAIDGSTSPVTYTLTAPMRNEHSKTIEALLKNDYSKYAGADGYYDLSLHNIGYSEAICSQTTERNTANCYIVQGYGKFKIPLVYGNGVKKGKNNPIAYAYTWGGNGYGVFTDHRGESITDPWLTTQLPTDPNGAKIVWQDETDVVREKSVKVEGDYLYFEIAQDDVQPTNILLAATVDGVIAWSWHIWVTAVNDFSDTVELSKTISGTTYKMNVAKRNLGWRTPEVKHYDARTILFRVVQNDRMGKKVQHNVTQGAGVVALGGANIVYQNGRKDPFLNVKAKVTSATVNSAGKITSVTYENVDLFKDEEGNNRITSINQRPKVEESIKNPNVLYRPGSNWFKETGVNEVRQQYLCWDPEGHFNSGSDVSGDVTHNYESHTKTIYDPCPVGFMVPNSGFAQMVVDSPGSFAYHTTMKDLDGNDVTAPIPYVTKGDLTFYLAGCRRQRYKNPDGVTGFGLADYKTYGYIWTAGAQLNGMQGVYLRASASALEFDPVDYDMCRAFAVRPIVDESAGVVQSWGSIAAGTFHEGNTTTDVELTQHGSAWGIDNLNSVSFTVNGEATPLTLQQILSNSANKERRIYVKDIKVYFEYSGWRTPLTNQTLQPYNIVYAGKERNSSPAYIRINSIPNHYQFSANWDRRFSDEESVSTSTDWQQLVPLTGRNVTITKVTADLRITYFD